MRATRCCTLRHLSEAATRQRQRPCADAADRRAVHGLAVPRLAADGGDAARGWVAGQSQARAAADAPDGHRCAGAEAADDQARSEEHTSELQSHVNIVCRLLLE